MPDAQVGASPGCLRSASARTSPAVRTTQSSTGATGLASSIVCRRHQRTGPRGPGRGKPLPYGQVYATLARLARDGKAVAGEAEPGGGPDRKRYAITPAGTVEVEAWLAEPSEPEPHLQTVLFAKVVLALMLGPDPVRLNAMDPGFHAVARRVRSVHLGLEFPAVP